MSVLPVPLTLLLCGLGIATGLRAASDIRPAVLATAAAKASAQSEQELTESAFTRGLAALKAKRFEEARLLFQHAARNTDIHLYPLSWLTAQFNACHTLCLQGKNTEAESLARSITSTCEAEIGLEDPLTSEALAYLAFVLKHLGHPQDAEPVYRRTVQVLEAKYGDAHPQVAIAMTKHGALLETLGLFAEAEAVQRRALGIMQKIGGENSATLCIFLTNLASCLQAQQQSAEAEQLMEQAYRIAQAHEDTSLQSAGTVLRKQAEFYRDKQQLDRAEELGHRALLRLAKRPEINRARFFYYDIVAELYRTILKAKGLNDDGIAHRLQQLESEASAMKTTASVLR
jgi:hypothetical protein